MKKFKKFMTVFLAIVMCVSSVLSVSAENTGGSDESRTTSLRAPVEGTILFSTDFAESNPFRAVGNGSKGTIGLVTDNDTARGQVLEIKKTASGDLRIDSGDDASPKFTFTSNAYSIVYEFDVKIIDLTNSAVNFNVRKKVNGSNTYAYPCKIVGGKLQAGDVVVYDNLSADTWYKVAVVQNYATGYRDVYLDGVKVSTDNSLAIESSFSTETGASDALRLAIEARGTTGEFRVDNIRIYEGTVPLPISSEGGNEGGEGDDGDEGDTTITLRDPVEGTKIYATDFETHNPFKGVTTGGTVTRVTDDEEHNTVVEMQRTTTGDLRLDPTASSFSTDSNSVVYEFDVKLLDVAEKSGFHLLLRKASATDRHAYVCTISGGKVFGYRSTTEVASLEANTWYTVSVVQNYKTMYRDIYIDGVKVSTDNTLEIEEEFVTGTTDLDRVKFESTSTSTSHFMLDNVRVYEGTKPYSGELLEKEEEEVVITIDPTKTVFEGEGLKNLWGNVYLDTLLEGYVALHTRSGLVYKGGNKTLLATAPVETTEGFDVVFSEICEALELTYSESGDTATVNGQTVAVSEKDGKVWVDAEAMLGTYGVVSIDTNESIKSNGMMIAGATAFSWPSDEDTAGADLKTLGSRSMLQNLNEYLFLEQPTAADITTLYEASAAKGEHPRVQATKEDFDRIKRESQTNEYVSNWYQQIIAAADYLVDVNTVPLTYEFRDGVRLLYVSRDMLDHMYTLGMAYQLTGEQKYVNRAWIDLEAVAGFPDWHPQHGLDTVEMSAAVAIGYDWMYHGLTEKQRNVVEKGMYKHAFTVACSGYQAWGNTFCSSVLQDGNQNFVVNAGFTMGALAMMDVYPEESAFITSGAIRAIGGMMIEFGPDGAWKEGPNYWEYSMQYTSKMLSSLECVFGTCFSLDKCEGLSTAGNYFMHVQSDRGRFNYGDGGTDNLYVPEIFYLADKYDNKALMTTLLNVNHGEMLNCEDVVLSLLWYDDSASEGTAELPIDGVYWTEGVATFRDAWTDGVTAFAGIHGGKTNVMHAQIDGGTFVYDYAGIRWAVELGSSPYSTSVSSNRAEDGGRWLLYKSKAEAHNTLVINPVDGTPEQKVGSTAKLLRFDKENKGAIAVLDLTENYADNATSAIRGMFFTDDRTSLVVRDEIKLSKADSTIYWFMHTEADVEIAADGKSATLMQDSQQVTLEFTTTGSENAELYCGPSTRALLGTTSPLAGTSQADADEEAADVNRIYIKLSGASGDVSITAKLTPANVNSTPISDYDKSIALWTIPEGEIAAKPEVQSVVIEGREIAFSDANKATFLCVEGKYDTVPVPTVTVDESKFTYEVMNATTTDSGVTTILVKDKVNLTTMTSYNIAFEEIPVAAVPVGFTGTALQVVAVEASDEPQAVPEGYVAWRVLDQDTDTRWTSKGIGNWILLELEEEATVDNMIILFKNGNVRYTYFNVSVSTDGEKFEMVYSGESGGPAIGSAEAYEQFSLGGKTAKYIKIGCNGNSKQGIVFGWNNIGEVVFTGTVTAVEPTPTPTVTPTPTPSATPSEEPTATPSSVPTSTPSVAPTSTPTPENVEIVANKTDESYTLGTNGTVTIYCTGELNEFVRVEMDGVKVDESNYTLEEGSTILTFKTSYLEALAAGDHTVKMIYTGDRSVVTTIPIKEKVVADDDSPVDNNTDDEGTTEATVDSTTVPAVDTSAAPTGDNNHLTLWMILTLAAFTGAVIYGIIYRKKFK